MLILAIIFIGGFLILTTYLINKPASEKSTTGYVSQRPLTDAEREVLRQAEESFDSHTAALILTRTYSGALPEHIAGNLWTDLYPDIFRTTVAGINFRKGLNHFSGLTFDALLIAEPTNKYDPNAIKIVEPTSDTQLGYIPADKTEALRDFLSGNLPHRCRVRINDARDLDDSGHERTYLYGHVVVTREES